LSGPYRREARAIFRQGDQERRQRDRWSGTKEPGEAFWAEGFAQYGKRRNRDPTCNET
jgi:hypothetical protein